MPRMLRCAYASLPDAELQVKKSVNTTGGEGQITSDGSREVRESAQVLHAGNTS